MTALLLQLKNGLWRLWFQCTTGSTNRRIFGSMVIIGGLTAAAKLISMLKQSFVAGCYGTSDAYDAFIIAQLVPITLVSLISGSLSAALIPTYIEVREKDGLMAASRLYSTAMMWNTAALFGVTMVMGVTAHLWLPLMASGYSPGKLALALSLFYWSLPMIVITGFSVAWGALLNAGERFAVVAFAPAMQPAAAVAALLLLNRYLGIYALLSGVVVGSLLEAAVVGYYLFRQGLPLLPKWHGRTEALRQVIRQYGACLAASCVLSGTLLVDQSMASMLGPRSNSALSYGSMVVGLILNLGAMSLGTAILPQLSKLVAMEDWKGLRHFLRVYSRLVLAVMIPFTIIMLMCSGTVIRLLFQRGAFSAEDTNLVTSVQNFYLLRLPFAFLGVLVTRSITALKANQLLTYVSLGTFIFNWLFDYFFMLKYGIAGITLSTSVCSLIALICLSLSLLRLIKKKSSADHIQPIV